MVMQVVRVGSLVVWKQYCGVFDVKTNQVSMCCNCRDWLGSSELDLGSWALVVGDGEVLRRRPDVVRVDATPSRKRPIELVHLVS